MDGNYHGCTHWHVTYPYSNINQKQTNIMENLNGKKVKVIGNTSNHGFPIGGEVTILQCIGGCPTLWNATGIATNGCVCTYNIYEADFTNPKMNKEDINKTIDELKEKLSEVQDKISYWDETLQFMDENSLTEFNDTEFKSYRVLKTINQDTTDMEKAKLIAKIINGDK